MQPPHTHLTVQASTIPAHTHCISKHSPHTQYLHWHSPHNTTHTCTQTCSPAAHTRHPGKYRHTQACTSQRAAHRTVPARFVRRGAHSLKPPLSSTHCHSTGETGITQYVDAHCVHWVHFGMDMYNMGTLQAANVEGARTLHEPHCQWTQKRNTGVIWEIAWHVLFPLFVSILGDTGTHRAVTYSSHLLVNV